MAPTLDLAAVHLSKHGVPKQRPTQTSNHFGALALPISALAFAILTPPLVKALAQSLRIGDESRAVRALTPMWEDLVETAAPEETWAISPFGWLLRKPRVQSRRQRIEISDAVGMISQYAEPLPSEIDEMIESNVRDDDQEEVCVAVELLLAAKHLAAVGGPKNAGTPRSAARDADIDSLARVWEQARNFAGAASLQASDRG